MIDDLLYSVTRSQKIESKTLIPTHSQKMKGFNINILLSCIIHSQMWLNLCVEDLVIWVKSQNWKEKTLAHRHTIHGEPRLGMNYK
jgi:hypothetical protein